MTDVIRVLPPAGGTDTAGYPTAGPANGNPHGGGAVPGLAMLARLAGESLARRQRGR